MTDDIHAKLTREILPNTSWEPLAPHFKHDAIFIVEKATLVDVGVALANDDVEAIKNWLEDQTLTRPTPDQAEAWAMQNVLFTALIVRPWVLIQPIPISPSN